MHRLGIADLTLVRNALKESNFSDADWFDLGLELSIAYPALQGIDGSNSSRCLRKCLKLWLSTSHCTWGELAEALQSMNQIETASQIRKICKCIHKHCTSLHHYYL